ncbi:hypothetical protein EDC14_1001235 [Hydrogenispora ethanolica]|uniref:PE family protein n=1 Tax=Hydrogenispora ethanolica TaxID=1082276 RepID=A0A4R1SD42_HYDET|nr:hypothetical protein [Hydrogenispora ethanolica]TCL76950.1 hypothetical protein EDC14_1001235 [Hydrogenispora ethanolica]
MSEELVQPTPSLKKRERDPQTIAAQLGRTAEMLAGLSAHAEAMARRGIDAAFVTRLSSTYQQSLDAHTGQLAYKARMMEQTKELHDHLAELYDLYSEARKQVKIELPQETWREFGIVDQR